ncbi:type VI secretion system Vgr family protein [Pseudooceanicola sp. 502str34]
MSDRIAELTTPLGTIGDAGLTFARMSGHDAISACFRFEVIAWSEDANIPAEALLGEVCSVSAQTDVTEPDQLRHFSGIVDQFSFIGEEGDFHRQVFGYRLVLRPNLWMFSKARDNRIFQELSVPEIISLLLDEAGFSNYELRLRGSYAPRVYCVQYGETTLDFLQRLMEHEGIFYFHEFAASEHRLVITDAIDDLLPQPQAATLRFEPDSTDALRGGGVITDWQRVATVVTGTHTQSDYDFEKPSADLSTQVQEPKSHANSEMERYDYPGRYLELSEGQRLTDLRWEEGQGGHAVIEAESTASLPWAGNTFDFVDFPRDAENDAYFILRAEYELWDDQYFAGQHGPGDAAEGFSARYRLLPKTSRWRPPHVTPRPVMRGPQTAIVVGPAGEEIYTDAYSRVKVQFHWDRVGARDENASCWVRVSSAWAGAGWGFIQIPRIGQEVIVDFLEGDPDQPIITGRVYNAEQMPPYALPGEATKSGWKSNSSLGGGGWNELMFEDRKGEELVYFQAEKDHDELVKNDETRHIGNDWTEEVVHDARQWVGNNRDETVDNCKTTQVKVDRTVDIGKDDTETVGRNRKLTVGVNTDEITGANHSHTVGANETIKVGMNRTDLVNIGEVRTVGATQVNTIGAARQVTVGVDQSHNIGASDSWSVGASQSITIGMDQSTSIGKNHTQSIGETSIVTVGKDSLTQIGENGAIDVGKTFTLNAGDSLNLTCGKASILMKKDGTITISGKDINITGKGKISAKASSEMTLKGSKINQN